MRKIGPIPEQISGPDSGLLPDHILYHPGGPRPLWGGYKPVRENLSWNEFCEEVAATGCNHFDDRWKAHFSDTRLARYAEGWYVEAPDRHTYRGCRIAMDALEEGLSDKEILELGIVQSELDFAKG